MQWATVAYLGFVFLGLRLLNRVMEGQFTTATETATINSLEVFREVSVFNLFTLPIPNLSLITEGVPQLLKWNYSFFGGNAQIISYFLQSISIGVAFGLFILVLGLLYNYFGRAR